MTKSSFRSRRVSLSAEESTNAYLNANWRAASESLKGILSKTIAEILIGILRKIFDNIPANYFIGDVEYQGN